MLINPTPPRVQCESLGSQRAALAPAIQNAAVAWSASVHASVCALNLLRRHAGWSGTFDAGERHPISRAGRQDAPTRIRLVRE